MPKSKKVTKASGYWLYMNDLMKNMGHRGEFRPFALRWDHLWVRLSDAEKQEWKARAKTVKTEVGEYYNRYLPLERILKKTRHDEQETEYLIRERMVSIHRILDLTEIE
jgi:hypothetical protein